MVHFLSNHSHKIVKLELFGASEFYQVAGTCNTLISYIYYIGHHGGMPWCCAVTVQKLNSHVYKCSFLTNIPIIMISS